MTIVMTFFRTALAVALLACAAQTGSSHAADITGEARAFVGSLGEQAIATAANKVTPADEREQRFKALFLEGFDVPTIGRFVLGSYWRQASEEQKTEFLALFEAMVIKTYSARFSEYAGETFTVSGARNEGDDHAVVQTQIVRPTGGAPIFIDWRILKPQGKLKIVDVIVEGVSMSVTQQQEFGSLIQRQGGQVSSLIDVLRQRYGKAG
jgi:phospholipid transport system substrate-binding protein